MDDVRKPMSATEKIEKLEDEQKILQRAIKQLKRDLKYLNEQRKRNTADLLRDEE